MPTQTKLEQLLLAATPVVLALAGCGGGASAGAVARPTFHRDIAPILFDHCAACHRTEGSAPFSLLSFQDARGRAPQLAQVTKSRYMPPWLPDASDYAFSGDCRLTDAQIATIQNWVASGCDAGDAADSPPLPEWKEGWFLGPPDLVVQMAEPYALRAEGTDVWRQFVIPVPLDSPRYVRAAEIRPSNKRVVHHAGAQIDTSGVARRLAAISPDKAIDKQSVREVHHPPGHSMNWLPGLIPFAEDPDMAWRIEPGTDLVVETHMVPSGKPEQVSLSVGLYFSDTPPRKFPAGLLLHDGTIDIPAGARDYEAISSFVLPVDAKLLGLLPHAHLLGQEVAVTATLPDKKELNLLHIAHWDFNWQTAYRFAEPVSLPRGTTLAMRIRYDNSADNARNPNVPPRRVQFGPRTSEEMAQVYYQLLPSNVTDSRKLSTDIANYDFEVTIKTNEFKLKNEPNDARSHSELGKNYLLKGRSAEGLQHLREAIKLDPNIADAHFYLGRYGFSLQQDDARREYEAALRADPNHREALAQLGLWHLTKGQTDDAEELLVRALKIQPSDAIVLNNLGIVRFNQKKLAEAVRIFQAALRVDPTYAPAQDNLRKIESLLKR